MMYRPSPARTGNRTLRVGSLLSGVALLAGLAGCPSTSGTPPVTTPLTTGSPGANASPDATMANRARIEVDACEHFEQGPPAAVTALPTDSNAPLVSTPHTRYDISLPGTGQRGLYVRYANAKAGEVVFFLDKDVNHSFTDDARQPIIMLQQLFSGPCARVKRRTPITMGIGTYYLRFDATTDSAVSLVAVRADDPGDAK